jgi:hypothetical protein
MGFAPLLKGEIAELLVRAYVLASGGGRLTTFKPDADVDHKDFVVDRRGGDQHAYGQVKCTTRLREKQVWCVVHLSPHRIPDSARFFYVFAFLDLRSVELTRMWLVPARDFNRLAYRKRRGKFIVLWFKAPRLDGRWDPFEVTKDELGPRIIELMAAAPAEKQIVAPAESLGIRLTG